MHIKFYLGYSNSMYSPKGSKIIYLKRVQTFPYLRNLFSLLKFPYILYILTKVETNRKNFQSNLSKTRGSLIYTASKVEHRTNPRVSEKLADFITNPEQRVLLK